VKAASIHSSTAIEQSPIPEGSVDRWVLFALDRGRYALPLEAVSRIVRAAEITPLPRAPRVVLGAIDVAGQVLPVFNVRGRFGLPERAIEPDDHFLIASSTRRTVVLPIDSALGVFDCPAGSAIEAALIAPELELVRGVIRLPDGLALIHDLELFLSADESRALDDAMMRDGARAD
jgi:purine-binding chemotaxis protein CheW